MRRKAIVVLGMHRSGTSALARVLNFLGCDLPRTLMPSAHGNPQGHWESNVVATLNDAILQSGGSSWDDWLEFNPQWYQSPVVDDFKARALQVLQDEYGDSPLFVLKDPRTCRLASFWLDVLEKAEVEPLIALPIRNPIEVAESLEARDGFPFDLSALLWLRHVLDAEHGSRGKRRVFLTYEGLLDDWTILADTMQRVLDIQWPRLSIKTGMDVAAFLDRGSRHHVHSQQHVASSPMLSQWVQEADDILARWAAQGEDPSDFAKLDAIRLQLNAAGPAFARLSYALVNERRKNIELDNLIRLKDEQSRQMDEAKSHLESEICRLSQLENTHVLLEQQLAESQAAVQRDRDDLAKGEMHIAALSDERQRLQQEIADKDTAIAALEDAKANLTKELHDAQQNIERTGQSLADRGHELAAAQSTLRQREEEIAQTLKLLDQERQRLGQEVADKDTAIAALEDAKANLTKELHDAQQNIERTGQSLADREHELAAAQSTLRQREEEIAQTLKLLDQERQRALTAELTLNTAQANIERLSAKLKAADEWVFRLSSERRVAEDRLAQAESKSATADRALQSASVKLYNMAHHHKLEADKQVELRSQIEAEIKTRDDLARSLRLAEDQIAQREQALQTLTDRLEAKERDAAQRLAQSQAEIAELNALLQQRAEDLALTQTSSASTQARLVETQKALDIAAARMTEMERREEENAKQMVPMQQYRDRERELTGLIESLRLQAKNSAQRWTASEAKMVSLSQLAEQQEAALSHLRENSNASQERIAMQSGEIERLSNDLRTIHSSRMDSESQREWLQQVNNVMTNYPQWWIFMPKKWRQDKINARLLRKGLFDANAYLDRYPDVSSSGIDPIRHYILHGMNEGRSI